MGREYSLPIFFCAGRQQTLKSYQALASSPRE
jgi:hypothetical protein